MKTEDQSTPERKQLAEALESQRTAMLALVGQDGDITTRPMTVQKMDEHGVLWMLGSRRSHAAHIGQMGVRANLSFSDEGKSLYVSICGQLRIDDTAERKHELWSVVARPWFPEGVDDPDLVCVALMPEKVDLWDGPDSSAVRALALVASVVAAKPIGLGTHETLSPQPSTLGGLGGAAAGGH